MEIHGHPKKPEPSSHDNVLNDESQVPSVLPPARWAPTMVYFVGGGASRLPISSSLCGVVLKEDKQARLPLVHASLLPVRVVSGAPYAPGAGPSSWSGSWALTVLDSWRFRRGQGGGIWRFRRGHRRGAYGGS